VKFLQADGVAGDCGMVSMRGKRGAGWGLRTVCRQRICYGGNQSGTGAAD